MCPRLSWNPSQTSSSLFDHYDSSGGFALTFTSYFSRALNPCAFLLGVDREILFCESHLALLRGILEPLVVEHIFSFARNSCGAPYTLHRPWLDSSNLVLAILHSSFANSKLNIKPWTLNSNGQKVVEQAVGFKRGNVGLASTSSTSESAQLKGFEEARKLLQTLP